MKHCRYELAIFDLDGTLLDTSGGILCAVRHTLQVLELPVPNEHTLLNFIGPPIEAGLAALSPLEGDALARAAQLFRTRYAQKDLFNATPYRGIRELLGACRELGITTAVATYKREDSAKRLLQRHGLTKYLSVIHGSDPSGQRTKQDIIELCLAAHGGPKDRAVMIGDTVQDANGAAAAGVDFIGVSWGFGFRGDESSTVPKIAHQPMDILQFLR